MQVVQQSPGALPSGAARHSRPPTPIAVMGFGGERDPEAPMGRARLQRQNASFRLHQPFMGVTREAPGPIGLATHKIHKYIQ